MHVSQFTAKHRKPVINDRAPSLTVFYGYKKICREDKHASTTDRETKEKGLQLIVVTTPSGTNKIDNKRKPSKVRSEKYYLDSRI